MNIQKIRIKAPAKINLHLEVIGKRKDGFHELAMIMQSIDLSDYLEIENNNIGEIRLTSNTKILNKDNLIVKASNLLKDNFKERNLGADIYLKKNIPIGAGLAGGSSDAAGTLVGLNKLWNLKLSSADLHLLAAKLGSDVPFCINGGSQYCFGRGESLEAYQSDSNYCVILIKNRDVSLSTSEIYRKYSLKFNPSKDLLICEINEKKESLKKMGFDKSNFLNNGIAIRNDLQEIAEMESSSVKNALSILTEFNNNLGYSMSGSGPSCYAVFENYNLARKCYEENIDSLKKMHFDVWICDFLSKGVSIEE